MKLKIHHAEQLKGTISISGAKNASLPLMACSLLTNEPIGLYHFPDITDTLCMKDILQSIGVEIQYVPDKQKMILTKKQIKLDLSMDLIQQIRASYYIMGALVGCNVSFETVYPGGCNFSRRPIDYHIDAFEKLGYQINEVSGKLIFQSPKSKKKKDVNIYLPQKSVGTTINILLASVKRLGKVGIYNASIEPEVLEVIALLKQMGAQIEVAQDTIQIEGVRRLKGASFTIMSDRIEAGSYLLLASAIPHTHLILQNVDIQYLEEVINTLQHMGLDMHIKGNEIEVTNDRPLIGTTTIVDIYPHFPTDLQQILSVVCLTASSPSIVKDLVYPNRFSQVEAIQKMGGKITIEGDELHILPSILTGTTIQAYDLRCGFACIVLGAIATHTTIIENAQIILRGYEQIISKLASIGISIQILENER
ncbi:MAG: UDP-N-acetylglucosamine 1-carboxyvinyltransferase [Prevotella sp.]|nr:UDP-N-acetylglucosamine 1-carboxyvinyltransferase [Staphylococcus sp.]MCM1350618.1 UDP-N-acetylglucosamine 1-carboxyvinyltransferase [Prevotella sp.]